MNKVLLILVIGILLTGCSPAKSPVPCTTVNLINLPNAGRYVIGLQLSNPDRIVYITDYQVQFCKLNPAWNIEGDTEYLGCNSC